MNDIHTRFLVSMVSVLYAIVAASSTAVAGGGASFEPLGFLHPDGAGPVIAYGLSADGSVVVGESNSTTGFQAFRWTQATGMVGLGAFPNPGGFPSSTARACSADGSIVVGASVRPDSLNENGSPFRWTQDEGLVYLGSLGGSSGGVARAVCTDGSVIVGYSSNANFNVETFRWTAEGMVGLGDLAGGTLNSQASAVSGDGSLVVGLASTSSSPYNRSFKWTHDLGMTELTPTTFRVIGMSRDGHYAVGGNLGRAARLDLQSGALVTLPHLAIPGLTNDSDIAWGANADGTVIVGNENLFQFDGFFGRAFIWDAQHGTRILRDLLINQYGLGAALAGWELNVATSVSDNGLVIAGYGFAPSGEQASWRITLPSECPADLDGNGAVDGADLGIVLGSWTTPASGCHAPAQCPADLNSDGVVDGADLGELLGSWGECR